MKIAEIRNENLVINDIPVLSDISLAIEKGETFGLIGPVNSGKTALARLLCGLGPVKPENVIFRGKKIAFVPTRLAFYDDLTAVGNIRFFASLNGLKRKQLKAAVEETLSRCGLQDFRKTKAAALPPGKKRILNIACAMAHNPDLLVIDQQTDGLLPEQRQNVTDLVASINTKTTTVLYISSFPDEIEACCGRIAILAYGKIIANGTSAELRDLVSSRGLARIWPLHIRNADLTEIKNIKGILNADMKIDHILAEYKKGFDCIETLVSYFAAKKNSILKIETDTVDLEQVYEALLGEQLKESRTIHA